MTQLLVMLVIGLLLLAFSLVALVRALRPESANSADSEPELSNMLRLASLEFDNPGLIFADADYGVLASEPRLKRLAQELRKDRRSLALAWLRECHRDVIAMWRFRRFLTRRGAPNATQEEVSAAFRSLGLVVLLAVMRGSVWVLGPYIFTTVAYKLRDGARSLRGTCVRALARLPQEQWPRVAAEWRSAQEAQ